MPRTPGATNRTPREIRKDGEHQIKLAKLKAAIATKNKEIERLKKTK